ncbi:glycosyltransferase [Rhodobacter ferrooxidans]|uniref:Glycosyl transferase family 2 n=1 Tax=Rhodobacter ferrooxidans TaxID=371731 RepID=C8S0Q3_9RHOB|nr:glycosyltransferase [Rhodobacter sp. SW2]EEW25344.1 glycosyl transferase family 2 [Rhodobacter sp. SW2]
MTIACLIPAWNEAARIGGVLQAAQDHPLIDELLVIDDGSTDATAEVAHQHGARVLATPGNIGKTAALAHGLRQTDAEHVLLLDADLLGLTAADITALLRPVIEHRAVATISLRGNAPRTWRLIGIDYISGERVIPRALLVAHLVALEALPRFGFEVFLNRLLIAAKAPVEIVRWPNVASPSKAAKRGRLAGLRADAAMMTDIFRTISPWQALVQIRALRALAPTTR